MRPSDTKEIGRLRENLRALLRNRLKSTQVGDEILEAIENLIDEKIDVATQEMDDRVNKRGIYDPDF